MNKFPIFMQFGEHAALVRWDAIIDINIHYQILQLKRFVSENFSEEIIETVPAYNELALYFKPHISVSKVLQKLKENYKTQLHPNPKVSNIVTIPVCYDGDLAPDMERVMAHTGLSKGEIIAKHTEPNYKVYFLGFLPGFPYLGGLPSELATPRHQTPREYVEKGAVAIGGNQTGIYPSVSPGGWNIIGRTPVQLFDLKRAQKALLQAGDEVRFRLVSKEKFLTIQEKLEREVDHD